MEQLSGRYTGIKEQHRKHIVGHVRNNAYININESERGPGA